MKKIFTVAMCLMVALSTMALPQFGKRGDRMHRTAPNQAELVRKAPVKAPAVANGQTYTIEGNDLYVGKNEMFELYMAFMGVGLVDIQGGLSGDKALIASLFVEGEDPASWYGEYAGDDVEGYIINPKNEEDYADVTFSSFKLSKTAKGDELTAVAKDEQGNTYNIHLTFFAPDKANDTIQIAFAEEAYLGRAGGTYFYAENDQYIATIYRPTDEIEGDYSFDDCDKQYTAMYKLVGGDTIHLGLPYDFKATVKLENGVYNVNAEYFTSGDSIVYQVSMKVTQPTAKKTVQVNLENALIADYIEDYGTIDMQAAPADSSYVISLSVYTEQAAGSYTDEDLDLYYSFVREGNEEVDIYEAEFKVEANADNSYTYKGWLLTMGSVKYEFVIKTVADSQEGIDQVNGEAVRTLKRLENGRLLIEKNGTLYDATGAVVY